MTVRVAYIGNFAHAHCTEVGVARGLEALGCHVQRIQQEAAHEVGVDLSGPRPDLLLYTRTHNHTALPERWEWGGFHEQGIITASVHLDKFFDLPREHLIHQRDPLFTTQHVFTADGGNQERFAAAGVNHHWMPPAFDAPAIEPTWWARSAHGNYLEFATKAERDEVVAGWAERYATPWDQGARDLPPVDEQIDVLFAGTGQRHYHPEYPARGKLIDFLRKTYGPRFVHVGIDGDRPKVHNADLTRLYRSAKVVVGDSCFANEGDGSLARNYWSDRIPETLGRGGVLVHAATDGLIPRTADDARENTQSFNVSQLMPHDPGDFDSLRLMTDLLLANEPLRTLIRDHGRRKVLAEHTWEVRMGQVLDACGITTKEDERAES